MGILEMFKKKRSRVSGQPAPIKYDSSLKDTLKLCKELRTDLVEMSEHGCTCGECAKYQGRVFSISGQDKKFPKLPEFILTNGGVHRGCSHTLSPFIYGVSVPVYHKDIVKFSNRPFIDNRSEVEIEEYEKRKREGEELLEDRKNYELLLKKLPNIAPKSFGGYRRMKNIKSKNYMELKRVANEMGIKI